MRKPNLPAFLASFLAHAGMFGWIIAHPGLSSLNMRVAHDRPALTVSLLNQAGSNQQTVIPAAIPEQQMLPPSAEAGEQSPETTALLPATEPDVSTPPAAENPASSVFNLPVAYYPAKALSRMPQPISKFEPRPPTSGDTGIGGKLAIQLRINATGTLDQLIVVKSDLPTAFEEAALAAFRQMRFLPGEINGVAVGAQVEVVIEYADLLQQSAQELPGNNVGALPLPAPPAAQGVPVSD